MLSLGSRRCSSSRNKKNITPYNISTTTVTGSSKGVRKSNKYNNKIIYLTNKAGGRGVRNDHVIYSVPKQYTKHTLHHMLHYSRPCVCGSLHHLRTTHVNCLLNPRYDDVKQARIPIEKYRLITIKPNLI